MAIAEPSTSADILTYGRIRHSTIVSLEVHLWKMVAEHEGCGGRPKIATLVESVVFCLTKNLRTLSSSSNSGVQSVRLEPLACEWKHATVSCELQAVKMAYRC